MVDKTEEEKDVWKTYSDYPFIEASNLGRIRTKDRYVTVKGQGKRLVKGRVLKQQLLPGGYMYVKFSMNGKTVSLRVHRVIATSFLPNPDNLPEVNHIDCDRTNNRLDNLEWCTRQENIAYRDKLGRTARQGAPKKTVIAINQETSEIFWFESRIEAERQLDVDHQSVGAVIRGKLNKTHGWWFANADETAVEKAREKFGNEVARKVEELIRQNQN